MEADYLGSRSQHLYTQTDINRYAGNLEATGGSLTCLNPAFGSIIYGQTIGNALASEFSFLAGRRFAHAWSARAIFTVGRALDADSSNDNGIANGRNILDVFNIQGQWGRSDYDVKKRLALDGVRAVPMPFQNRILKNTIGGWRLTQRMTLTIFLHRAAGKWFGRPRWWPTT
jgi:hypothetical protein